MADDPTCGSTRSTDGADALGDRAKAAVPSPSLRDDPPPLVAHFRVQGLLGRGGMGVVYRALDESLRRTIALKLLPAAHARDPERRQRFLREARSAAALLHPNVGVIHEVGESEGRFYIAMELVDGVTLRQRLDGKSLPPDVARDLALQIAQGLAAAHAQGIVHRDLKPENVMVTRAGVVKLLDFGLAKSGSSSETDSEMALAETEALLTREGHILGSSPYMSPEQAIGGAVDARSDVFSFGIVLYEMLAGRRPFVEATHGAVRAAIASEPPPPLVDVDEELGAIALRCLAKKPGDRFVDAGAIASALSGARASVAAPTVTAPRVEPAPAARPRARTGLVVTCAALGLAAVVGWRGITRRTEAPPRLTGMVAFWGGEFTMGRTAAEADAECAALGTDCRRDVLDREQPDRTVTLSPFQIDVNEVTSVELAQWLPARAPKVEMYEGTKVPHVLRDHDTGAALLELEQSWSWLVVGEGGALAVTPGQERSPATGVTWDGARLYCASRGKRLPTDAEWEYAARGRTHRRYPWGDAPPACDGAIFGRVKDLACAALPHGPGDVGAATQDRTAEGVHDLFGNASEWVEDAYVAPYLPGCGACKDPVVAPTGREADDERVVRGNSWMVSLFGMTSARTRWRRGGSTAGIGFRCAASTR